MSEKNYQQIYEELLTVQTKEALEFPDRFFDLSVQQRRLIEELLDLGHQTNLYIINIYSRLGLLIDYL